MQLAKNKISLIAVLPLVVGALITAGLTLNLFNTDINNRLQNIRDEEELHIKHELMARINTVYDVAQTCYQQGNNEQKCLETIGDIRFGDNYSNYVWIHKLDPDNLDSAYLISHPRKSILGQNLAGYIDLENVEKIYYKGEVKNKLAIDDVTLQPKKLFTLFNKLALNSGEGFVLYYWPKSTQESEFIIGYPKVSFIKLLEPFSWVIGAGEYEDFIDDLVQKERLKLLSARNKFFLIFSITFLITLIVLVGLSTLLSNKVYNSLEKYEQQLLQAKNEVEASEKRLYDIAFNSGDVIWEVDTNGEYRWVSGAISIFGVGSEELIGTSIFDRVPDDSVREIKLELAKVQKARANIENLESKFLSGDNELYIQINGVPVFDESGDLIGYRGVFRDITKIKKEEEQQQRLERELQQANKMEAVGTLAAGIAHEINTPAQFVGTNLEFLDESFGEVNDLVDQMLRFHEKAATQNISQGDIDALADLVEELDWPYLEEEIPLTLAQSKDGVKRISTIVTAMKEFSHPGGKDKSLVDLVKVLETTITVSRNEWKYVSEMNTHFPEKISMVLGYSDELGQVFLNLIVNAAHAIEAKLGRTPDDEKGMIDITVTEEADTIIVEVADTGSGISEEARTKVFDPFFTTKKLGKGTGQGLAIAHDVIVGKHNGAISLDTELGKGSTFIVRIPKQQEDSPLS